jgi:hypothetical protein
MSIARDLCDLAPLRKELLHYMLREGLGLPAISKSIGVANQTVKNFLYDAKPPRFTTLLKIIKFLEGVRVEPEGEA